MKLPKTIKNVLEEQGFWYNEPVKQDDQYYVETGFGSDAGEDFFIVVWYDGTKEGFIDAFYDEYLNFDPDEHAEMWIEGRGKNGVPSSIRELIDDADSIDEHLENTALELNKLI